MKNHNSKVNLMDFTKELFSLRKRIIEEIKSTISNNKCACAELYDNDVFVANYDPEALIKRISRNGRVVIQDPINMHDENKTLESFSTEMLMLTLKTLHKNPKVFKKN